MAVTAKTDEFELLKPVTSCGACLQVMAECEKRQNSPFKMLLYCIGGPVWADRRRAQPDAFHVF
jgi:cytidine deaminase